MAITITTTIIILPLDAIKYCSSSTYFSLYYTWNTFIVTVYGSILLETIQNNKF
jgi:hypothetical protein